MDNIFHAVKVGNVAKSLEVLAANPEVVNITEVCLTIR